jgi:hypothetical protein
MVMPLLNNEKTLAASGPVAEEGRRPTSVPGMGTGLEVEVLCGASW